MSNQRILYLSHDGLMESLSQSQVWQYLYNLAKKYDIMLVTYEKEKDWFDFRRRNEMFDKAKEAGIRWIPLKYHNKPKIIASCVDMISCLFISIFLKFRYCINIVHARNAPFTLIALVMKTLFLTKFVFDMRGFWADERVDGGLWKKNSLIYRINKWLEKLYFLRADTVVVLTRAAVKEINKFSYLKNKTINVKVIPTCTNLQLFKRKVPESDKKQSVFTLGYLGNVGTWYLLDPVFEFFKILREKKPEARLVFINDGQHDFIKSKIDAFDLPRESFEIRSVEFEKIPGEISKFDAAIFFIKPVFSKKSSMPTKFGELLGCGIPCVTNMGVGDMDVIIDEGRVGVLLRDFKSQSLDKSVEDLLDLLKDDKTSVRCRKIAERYFSLENGVKTYDEIYSAF